jgi:uncharacterized protein YhbP (UPF0306 family)
MIVSDTFPDILKELCGGQPLAVLATASGTAPYANLVAVAFAPDLHRLFFATSRATRKWHNLASNPQVSLLLDNRSNQAADFSRSAAATILGTAKELMGDARKAGRDLYAVRHPQLIGFIDGSDCALFQVAIERVLLVTRFQEVVQFDFPSS